MKKENRLWPKLNFPHFVQRLAVPGAPHRCEAASAEAANAMRKKVLVVDDDAVIRMTTGSKFQKAGYQVRTAGDCSEAIAAVGENPPDIILVDLNFPPDVSNGGLVAWDGFRLMHWLRGLQNTGEARFIVISGSDSTDSRRRAMASGAAAYFQKPLDHERLLTFLHVELESQARAKRAQFTFEI